MELHSQHLSDAQFQRLRRLIHSECGIHLSPPKRVMLESRLRKRAQALGLSSLGEYCEHVLSSGGQTRELISLLDAVTTNKTDFFRESVHFDILRETALPELEAGRVPPDRPLKLWSAGCSTGQEPYTLAMVLSEYASVKPGFRFEILGSDLSRRTLEHARQAIYTVEEAEAIPIEIRRRHLLISKDRARGLVRVVPEIRRLVGFRRLNLMDEDYGFSDAFDVIFCRNVMIYFERSTQLKLVSRLGGSLRPGGYLFTGHSESLHGFDLRLIQVAPTVYRRLHGEADA